MNRNDRPTSNAGQDNVPAGGTMPNEPGNEPAPEMVTGKGRTKRLMRAGIFASLGLALLLVGAVTGYLSSPTGRSPLEVVQGAYTSLPTQIFSWSRLAGEGWKANTAAAIVVLLVIILAVNLTAILLRNRYERRW